MARHKHADVIHAWADGAEIQKFCGDGWYDDSDTPNWFEDAEYRIKPRTVRGRMTDRELLDQALKLVSKYHARETILVDWEKSVIEAISARLNERESSDKPVAWVSCDGYLSHYRLGDEYIPLYRHPPPARKLTDEEISQVGEDSKSVEGNHILPFAFARAIEQKIWEKAE